MRHPWTIPFALTLLLAGVVVLPGCGVADLVEEVVNEEKDVPMGASMTSGELGQAMDVLRRVNAVRAAHELPPLLWDGEAADLAYDHAVDMRRRSFYAHRNPDGLSARDRAEQRGLDMTFFVGENIARHNDSAEDVMNAWMNSPGHRGLILSEVPTHVGIGLHDGKGGPWWVQEFYTRME